MSNKTYYKNSKKNRLIQIYNHTVHICNEQKFKVMAPIKYSFESQDLDIIAKSSKVNSNILLSGKINSNILLSNNPEIIIENTDSFELARKITTDNEFVLVLNMASNIKPGGGVANGAIAQEEDLFRCSNYFQAIDPIMYANGGLRDDEVIYSPIVHIIKDKNYSLLNYACQVSCLAVAALRKPKISVDLNGMPVYVNTEDMIIMRHKIEMIFKVAIKHGHTKLVLGAIGCGVFGNPPELVAAMFKDCIGQYGGYFKQICFAILSRNEKEDHNFQTFKKTFNEIPPNNIQNSNPIIII
jgi:uncharacterized protein (TIGR02452 family)